MEKSSTIWSNTFYKGATCSSAYHRLFYDVLRPVVEIKFVIK